MNKILKGALVVVAVISMLGLSAPVNLPPMLDEDDMVSNDDTCVATQQSIKKYVDDSIGSWTTWSPTLTNLTLGNGTVVARYTQIGKTVHARFKFTLGSTSSVGTAPQISLPATAHTDIGNNSTCGPGRLLDSGTANHLAMAAYQTSTTIAIRYIDSASLDKQITASLPFVWTTGDAMMVSFTYEAN